VKKLGRVMTQTLCNQTIAAVHRFLAMHRSKMNRECKSKASAMAMAKASPSVWPAGQSGVTPLLCPPKASMKTLVIDEDFGIS